MVNNNLAVLRYVRKLREIIEDQRSRDYDGLNYGYSNSSVDWYEGALARDEDFIDLLNKKEKELMEEEGL